MINAPSGNVPQDNSGLIQQAAFNYLNNTFSQNPAQPLNQARPGQGGGVQQPAAPQSGLGKASEAAGLMSKAGISSL